MVGPARTHGLELVRAAPGGDDRRPDALGDVDGREPRRARRAVDQHGLASGEAAAVDQAVVGGLVVAQQVRALIEAQGLRQPDQRVSRGHGPAREAAPGLVAPERARPRLQAIGDHAITEREALDLGPYPGNLARVLEPRGVGRLDHVLVLPAAHDQVDPADGGAADLDQDVRRRERPGIGGRVLGAQLEVVVEGVEGGLAELAQDHAMVGREVRNDR